MKSSIQSYRLLLWVNGRREHHYRGLVVLMSVKLQELPAIDLGHINIQKDHIGLGSAVLKMRNGRLTVRKHLAYDIFTVVLFKHALIDHIIDGVVIHQQIVWLFHDSARIRR